VDRRRRRPARRAGSRAGQAGGRGVDLAEEIDALRAKRDPAQTVHDCLDALDEDLSQFGTIAPTLDLFFEGVAYGVIPPEVIGDGARAASLVLYGLYLDRCAQRYRAAAGGEEDDGKLAIALGMRFIISSTPGWSFVSGCLFTSCRRTADARRGISGSGRRHRGPGAPGTGRYAARSAAGPSRPRLRCCFAARHAHNLRHRDVACHADQPGRVAVTGLEQVAAAAAPHPVRLQVFGCDHRMLRRSVRGRVRCDRAGRRKQRFIYVRMEQAYVIQPAVAHDLVRLA
jgi:hypothetical protein